MLLVKYIIVLKVGIILKFGNIELCENMDRLV